MTQRTRQGIATTYRGVRFRSRLEARWAVFFDAMGWRWEYEPFDADGYIPDFVLLGDDPVLVEVKPAIVPDDFDSVAPAAYRALDGHWRRDILFVGVTPFFCEAEAWQDGLGLGLLGEYQETEDGAHWWTGIAVWNHCGLCGDVSFIHDFAWYRSRLCGHHDGDHYVNPVPPDHLAVIEQRWAHANNLTQWRP